VNRLTLAVAGGRKTSSIIDACCQAGTEDRILVLTFTQANQRRR
jgi:DNA helicase II / ATP-dependent DNA helicase PcrA